MKLKISSWSSLQKFPNSHRPKKSGDRQYISINPGRGCSSAVGKQGRRQTMSLGRGCVSDGTIVHEFVHAIGFHHEQTRPDRDKYVKINFQNIRRANSFNFQKQSSRSYTTLFIIDHFYCLLLFQYHTYSKAKVAFVQYL